MRLIFFLFMYMSFLVTLSAQEDTLPDLLTSFNDALQELASDKSTIRQELTYDVDKPYRVVFRRIETDKRGSETMEFHLNLAFLEKRMVQQKSSRREMTVEVSASDELIKVFEDGELDGYQDDLSILCVDINQARQLEDLLAQAIVVARKLWEEEGLVPQAYDELEAFLIDRLSEEVIIGDESYVQTLQPEEGSRSRFTFNQRFIDDKGEQESILYTFDFSDINPTGINIEVKGEEIYLEMLCFDGNDYMARQEEGETEFTDQFKVYVNGYEEAQVLLSALQAFAKMGKEQFQEKLPDLTTNEAALSYLEEQIQSFTFNEQQITQEAEVGCLFEIAITTTEDDEAEIERYLVDMSDLAPTGTQFDISSDGIRVVATVRDGDNFVMVFEDGEQEKYDDELPIAAPDIPTAKRLRHGLTRAIATCKNELLIRDFAWMSAAVKSGIKDLEKSASLTQTEGEDACAWTYQTTEEGRRGEDIERFEFNLYDLNEKSFELETKDKEVYVHVYSNYKEPVITLYDEENEIEYENQLTFELADIQTGKQFIATFMTQIEGCKN